MAELLVKRDTDYEYLKKAINEDDYECPKECNKYCHAETCQSHDWPRLITELQKKLNAYKKFYQIYDLCVSNRGKFSCTPHHDSRCEYQLERTGNCVCGAKDLDEADNAIQEVEKK